MEIIVLFLWFSIIFIIYTYLGYPALLKLLSVIKKNSIKISDNYLPTVSIIISAYNEQNKIRSKLINTLECDYPGEKIEILVASDCSTDNTDAIVKSFKNYNIRLIRNNHRKGKEAAQKLALKYALNEIIIFTDSSTQLEKESIKNIVKYFEDDKIGCVSSIDKIIDEGGNITGENFYIKYEMWLRDLESQVYSLVGLTGAFFAARKNVCLNFETSIPSDFNIVLNSIEKGMIGISAKNVFCKYKNVNSEIKEFNRKVRTVTRGLNTFFSKYHFVNPLKYGFFSIQLLSHKFFRWLIPFFLINILLCNSLLINYHSFYFVLIIIQLLFYIFALLGFISSYFRKFILFKIPYYFVMTNYAILLAWINYLKGEKFIIWNPTSRNT
ncbi:MAG: glycosyltransferase family 2 protein [Promethearchaeota archaeon]